MWVNTGLCDVAGVCLVSDDGSDLVGGRDQVCEVHGHLVVSTSEVCQLLWAAVLMWPWLLMTKTCGDMFEVVVGSGGGCMVSDVTILTQVVHTLVPVCIGCITS